MNAWRRHAAALVRDPLRAWRPLRVQHAFLSSRHRRRLLRAGNQWGKTTAGAVDLLAHVTGVNPWCPAMETPEPIEAWVICASWSQSVVIQRKIYELLDPDLLHPETVFDDVRGFKGKNPAFRIRHKSGGYSLVRIKTMGQGGLRLASATIQYAWFDEPPESPRIYSEITKRVMRAGTRGRIILTMTPVNARVDWIQEAAERRQLEDHHARMEPHEFVPMVRDGAGRWREGTAAMSLADGTVCDTTWIAEQIADTLPHEVPVVCHGEWRMSAEAPIFHAFRTSGPDAHVTTLGPPPGASLELWVGIDHGVRSFTQVAVLVYALRGTGPDDPDEVWVVDEYVGATETTEDDDAEGILAMLERQNDRWAALDQVHGDRAHAGQGRGPTVSGKSNETLARAIAKHPRAKQHGIRRELHPPIQKAKRGVSNKGGSVEYGCAWIHRAMVRGRFHIHPRCVVGIKSLLGYDMTPNSDESHWVDALRYTLRPAIWRYGGTSHPVHVSV